MSRRTNLTLGATLVLSLVLMGTSTDVQAQTFDFVKDLSKMVYGWFKTIGLAIVLPILAFGLVKAIWSLLQGDAAGRGSALTLVKGGLIAVITLLSLEWVLDSVVKITSDTGGQIKNTINSRPPGGGSSGNQPSSQ